VLLGLVYGELLEVLLLLTTLGEVYLALFLYEELVLGRVYVLVFELVPGRV
jgi:hypothetical protein